MIHSHSNSSSGMSWTSMLLNETFRSTGSFLYTSPSNLAPVAKQLWQYWSPLFLNSGIISYLKPHIYTWNLIRPLFLLNHGRPTVTTAVGSFKAGEWKAASPRVEAQTNSFKVFLWKLTNMGYMLSNPYEMTNESDRRGQSCQKLFCTSLTDEIDWLENHMNTRTVFLVCMFQVLSQNITLNCSNSSMGVSSLRSLQWHEDNDSSRLTRRCCCRVPSLKVLRSRLLYDLWNKFVLFAFASFGLYF